MGNCAAKDRFQETLDLDMNAITRTEKDLRNTMQREYINDYVLNSERCDILYREYLRK